MYTIKKLDIESLDAILALEKLCFPVPDRWKEEDWRRLLERDRDTSEPGHRLPAPEPGNRGYDTARYVPFLR